MSSTGRFTMGAKKKPHTILGIVGDSATGKSTMSDGIANILGPDKVTVICTDDYHRYDRKQRAERNITPRICARASFNVKYRWPELHCLQLDNSPSTARPARPLVVKILPLPVRSFAIWFWPPISSTPLRPTFTAPLPRAFAAVCSAHPWPTCLKTAQILSSRAEGCWS